MAFIPNTFVKSYSQDYDDNGAVRQIEIRVKLEGKAAHSKLEEVDMEASMLLMISNVEDMLMPVLKDKEENEEES